MSAILRELSHDHAHVHRLMADVSQALRAQRGLRGDTGEALADSVAALRDELFEHFAREEGGLFPALRARLPALSDALAKLERGHDVICGALSRMLHAISGGALDTELPRVVSLFERFQSEYAAHAQEESDALREAAGRLTEDEQREIARLSEGL